MAVLMGRLKQLAGAGEKYMSEVGTTPRAGEGHDETLIPLPDLADAAEPAFAVRDGKTLLRGGESASSGIRTFPRRYVCPETGARDVAEFLFGPSGKLYSFSQVHVSTSRPVPYTIGYVDFPEGVRVLAEIRASDPSVLTCDLPVELRAEGGAWFVVPVGNGA